MHLELSNLIGQFESFYHYVSQYKKKEKEKKNNIEKEKRKKEYTRISLAALKLI